MMYFASIKQVLKLRLQVQWNLNILCMRDIISISQMPKLLSLCSTNLATFQSYLASPYYIYKFAYVEEHKLHFWPQLLY